MGGSSTQRGDLRPILSPPEIYSVPSAVDGEKGKKQQWLSPPFAHLIPYNSGMVRGVYRNRSRSVASPTQKKRRRREQKLFFVPAATLFCQES